jgi:hypothetical protein
MTTEVLTDDPGYVADDLPERTMYMDYVDRLRGPWTDIRFHLPYLFETALNYPDMQVLEVGTRDCNSTCAFLAAAEAVGGIVHSVDINDPDIPDAVAGRWTESKRWEFKKANDLSITATVQFDIVFVDTSHELYHTMSELRKFFPMIRPGGRMLLHDTEWVGMDSPSAQYMRGDGKGWGPVAWALDWFCDYDHQGKIRWINHPGSFGLGEIRVEAT